MRVKGGNNELGQSAAVGGPGSHISKDWSITPPARLNGCGRSWRRPHPPRAEAWLRRPHPPHAEARRCRPHPHTSALPRR
eukprot:362858-Chlamydomonas_euryale.AAC.9